MKRLKSLKKAFRNFLKDESGQGTAEYVLLIAIVIGLIVAFKDPIKNAMKGQVDKVSGQLENFEP